MAMGKAAEVKDIPDVLVGAGDSVIAIHRPTVRIRARVAMQTSILFMFGLFVTAWSFE
jgi:hypothetical protein